jgi:formylglycine-generating enzyme required for sulfatase activity/serine/threonine protein kinase
MGEVMTDKSASHIKINPINLHKVKYQVGSRVASYIIIRLIYIDGLTQTYLVKNSETNKEYLLKLLTPDILSDPDFKKRIKEIQEKMEVLGHPNLLVENRINKFKDDYYVIDEYVPGKTGNPTNLEEEISSGTKFSDEEIKKILIQLISALNVAYKYKNLNCIHYDLKPSRIFLDKKNNVKLADFLLIPLIGVKNFQYFLKAVIAGIKTDDLKKINENLEDDIKNNSVSMSGINNLDNTSSMLLLSEENGEIIDVGKAKFIGSEYLKAIVAAKPEDNSEVMLKIKCAIEAFDSIEHMSPEQAAGNDVTLQSNIYSLGFLMYRLLTGKKLAGSWGVPSSFGCSKDWDNIVLKTLKRDPEYRYQNYEELITDLEQVGKSKGLAKTIFIILAIIISIIFGTIIFNFNSSEDSFDFKEDNTTNESIKQQIKVGFKSEVKEVKKKAIVKAELNITPKDSFLILYKDKKHIKEIGNCEQSKLIFNLREGEYKLVAGKIGYKDKTIKLNLYDSYNYFELKLDKNTTPPKVKQYTEATGEKPEKGKIWYIKSPNLKMIPIKPGKFTMGRPTPETGKELYESPAHWVKITHNYWISEFEIKQKDYKQIMNSNPSFHIMTGKDSPVEMVSWLDATKFCKRLTTALRDKKYIPNGYEIRLPTEAEWEYAYRAQTTTEYPFKSPETNIYRYAWFTMNSDGKVHKPGLLHPNYWGLYDMSGNVWEWCIDGGYKYTARSRVNPVFLGDNKRIIRGGAFNTKSFLTKSASRVAVEKDYKSKAIGFRIVLAPIIKKQEQKKKNI